LLWDGLNIKVWIRKKIRLLKTKKDWTDKVRLSLR
jgi:hypothetical protein